MKILLETNESENLFFNSMCNVFGTGYIEGYGLELTYNKTDYNDARNKLTSPCYEEVLLQILKDGNKLTLVDHVCEGEYTRSITLEDVHTKVSKTPLRHLMNAIEENDDAETGDIIIQTVFFDEIIFG
jgi:hypothetical protein